MSVLVYTENWDGKFKKQTFELVSFASEIAKMISSHVTAVSIGKVDDAELAKPGNYGAAKIISIDNDQLRILDSQARHARRRPSANNGPARDGSIRE